jgi:aminobenzoyl-glutamate transport protein
MSAGWLNTVERIGNRLPDPSTLFAAGTVAVMLLSQVAVWLGWEVSRTVQRDGQFVIEPVTPVSLLDADGVWWLLSNLVDNFVDFPPLGLVLVGLLGIGVAERSGLLPVLLRRLLAAAPSPLLVPMTVFVGVLSSLALDAGYVVLPPLAGALFLAAGRSPLAGIAAVTAGVTCGFSANLFITGLDPLLAGLSTAAAALLDPELRVAISANWWFMIASTLLLTATGALVTWRSWSRGCARRRGEALALGRRPPLILPRHPDDDASPTWTRRAACASPAGPSSC